MNTKWVRIDQHSADTIFDTKIPNQIQKSKTALGTEYPALGYELSRLCVRNVQTAGVRIVQPGYESSNLGTNRLGYEMSRVQNVHNSIRNI